MVASLGINLAELHFPEFLFLGVFSKGKPQEDVGGLVGSSHFVARHVAADSPHWWEVVARPATALSSPGFSNSWARYMCLVP